MRNIMVWLCVLLVGFALAGNDSSGLVGSAVTEYPRQQFLARVAQTNSESMADAEERVTGLEVAAGAEAQYAYCEYVSIFDYGAGYAIEAGVLFLIKADGQGRQICGTVGKWTGVPQDKGHQWSEAYHVVDWTSTQLVQMIRGRVAVSIKMSGPVRSMLRLRLRRLGFQEGIMLDRTWHSAKMGSWQDAYSVDGTR